MKIRAKPGRYFATGSMDWVTSVIGTRHNDSKYLKENRNSEEIVTNIYYINDGLFPLWSNIRYGNATFSLSCLCTETKDKNASHQTMICSSVYGLTCDSFDCLAKLVDLPELSMGDHLLIYNVDTYSPTCLTDFEGFRNEKYVYIWRD